MCLHEGIYKVVSNSINNVCNVLLYFPIFELVDEHPDTKMDTNKSVEGGWKHVKELSEYCSECSQLSLDMYQGKKIC